MRQRRMKQAAEVSERFSFVFDGAEAKSNNHGRVTGSPWVAADDFSSSVVVVFCSFGGDGGAMGVEDKEKAGRPDPQILRPPATWIRSANFTQPPHDKT